MEFPVRVGLSAIYLVVAYVGGSFSAHSSSVGEYAVGQPEIENC